MVSFHSSQTPNECIPYWECRAKTCPDGSPGTFVFDHCRYAGYVAEGLLALLPTSVCRLFPSETPFLVSLHDIGKVSPGFEGKYFIDLLRKMAPLFATEFVKGGYTTTHASIGAKSLMKLFSLEADHPIVRAIVAHHGYASQPPYQYINDGLWQKEREALIRALATDFGVIPETAVEHYPPADLLAGITCVADWIASDESFFPPDEPSLSSEEGRRRAADALIRCGFTRSQFRPGLSFNDIFGFAPYPAQQTFIDAVNTPGVYVLEAPMGMGKTESALFAAYKFIEKGIHSGLYFALPTHLTSDRIHERVIEFLKKVSAMPSAVKLAHGQAWLKEFENKNDDFKLDWGNEGTRKVEGNKTWFEVFNPNEPNKPEKLFVPRWFNPSKRGLLFPFAVGTIDQALLAVLNVKHAFVRSFALAGKVVILDEVHSYDAYTGTLLDELVKRLHELGCTVIILSATLTAVRRKALLGAEALPDEAEASGYPLLSCVRADEKAIVSELPPPPSRSVRLRWIDASAESPLGTAISKARAGCNVLCITNSVATAQEWYRMLKSELAENEFPIGLLHSKFTTNDRDAIESKWMRLLGKPDPEKRNIRPHGSILVATQIVEQSVDIDADWMLSELAPIDMLLQRIGRLWRHNRATRPVDEPELAIVCAKMPAPDLSDLSPDTKELEAFFGRGVWVYAPYVLLRTFETLRFRQDICVPDDMRQLLETIYSDAIPDSELYRTLLADMNAKAEILHRLASMGQSDVLPTRNDDEGTAGTRYDSRPSVTLLLVRSIDASAKRDGTTAELLDRNAVFISRFHRDFTVTKKLYQNLVQVAPNDMLSTARKEKNDAGELSCHFFASDMPIICIWDAESGALTLRSSGENAGYYYHPEFGAYRTKAADGETGWKRKRTSRVELHDEFYFNDKEDW